MAVSQRPAALATLGEPSGPPAWRTLPSWYLVASQDRVIPPAAERAMAARAGSTTVEIDSSHVAMISHPDEVADLITAGDRRGGLTSGAGNRGMTGVPCSHAVSRSASVSSAARASAPTSSSRTRSTAPSFVDQPPTIRPSTQMVAPPLPAVSNT